MANTFDTGDYFYSPRDRERPSADDPEAAFYGEREPLHWVDADGVVDPHEGTLSPLAFYYSAPVRRQPRRHSIVPWLVLALVILLALPILKLVLTVLAVISVIIVAVLGLSILALVVGAFILAQRLRTLSRRMYL